MTGVEIASLIVSGFALAVSIFFSFRAEGIEDRLRKRDDKRQTFDVWIRGPLDLKLVEFIQTVRKISAAARASADMEERRQAISVIQRSELDQWYFEIDALCREQSDPILRELSEDAFAAFDSLLEVINDLGVEQSDDDVRELSRKMVDISQHFISATRAKIQAERLAIK